MATHTTYQLSAGQRRSVYVDTPEKLFNAFYQLTDFDGGDPADDMILLAAEGRHRTVFINKSALDYVTIPTHQYAEGRTDANAIWTPSTACSNRHARRRSRGWKRVNRLTGAER